MELTKILSKRQRLSFFVVLSSIILFIAACTDDPLKVGFNLLQGDTLNVNEMTIPVDLYTVSSNPVDARSIRMSPLGSINDPIFGRLKADFVTNLMWDETIRFKDSLNSPTYEIEVYELELLLKISNYYGDINDIVFEVYELTDDLPDSSLSNFKVTSEMINPIPINIGPPVRLEEDLNTAINDTMYYSVKLNKDYRDKFIDPQLSIDSAYGNLWRNFRIALKGLYISTISRNENDFGGGIITISQDTSQLVLRTIEKTSDGTNDTIDNHFVLASSNYKESAHINMYENENGQAIDDVIDKDIIFSNTYIEALAGPKVEVRFPTLNELRQQFNYDIIINKAELIIPVDESQTDHNFYKAPNYLGVKDFGTDSAILDDGYITGYIGGKFDTSNYQYKLNIANHIHAYMNDVSGTEFSDKLYLFAADFFISPVNSNSIIAGYSIQSPGRVVLMNSNTSRPPVLHIIYSKLPN